jgi:hypothetical protein
MVASLNEVGAADVCAAVSCTATVPLSVAPAPAAAPSCRKFLRVMPVERSSRPFM